MFLGKSEDFWTELCDTYQRAYDESAGPPQFRHSVNHFRYHQAGLLAVYHLKESQDKIRERSNDISN